MNPLAWLVPGALTAVAGIVAFLSSKRAWAAIDTPTIATGNVVIGRVEVTGHAGVGPSGIRVVSPITAETCVWWSVEVEEETGSGKDRSWKSRHKAFSEPGVTVDDGSGPILVDLTGTSLRSPESQTHNASKLPPSLTSDDLTRLARGTPYVATAADDDRGFFAKMFDSFSTDAPLASLSGNWRVTETYLPDGADLYVLGTTRYDETRTAAVFTHAKDHPLYAYAGTEKQLTRNAKWIMVISALLMLALSYVTVAVFTGSTFLKSNGKEGIHPDWQRGPIGPTVVFMAMFVVQVIRVRNRIVAVREQHVAALRLVDIAAKKRATLVPQLTEVVKAAAAHEQGAQTMLAHLRADEFDSAQLVAIVEKSPSLQTNTNFLQMQRALTDVENDLAVARRFVADAQNVFRTRVQSFPDSLVAPWLQIKLDAVTPTVS